MTATTLTALAATVALGGEAPKRVHIGQPAFYSTHCADAYRAVRWYRARYDKSRTELGYTPAPRIETGMDCERLRLRAVYWVAAAKVNRVAAIAHHAYHWAWTRWLPDKWARIGACETGYGRRPGNWEWDSGTYVSAFGIYRPAYRQFAAIAGVPDWDAPGKRTPREQWKVALAIHARYGFSGWGCRGA